ncbi:hypothetical protein [Flavobacterium reichenbachii]|uniref:Uncharacterized protein n=1 Tax=Flavobacterium reichenbachii TaxID=362418 RepID=A0A085ZLU3_9FLAO|nr:hypothetical protein [Flavobacterium reichenbachii]KFF05407.1 hypothetical protein IW19_07630 [Flavobacterium reichenbachii]OXB12333.1 hypothetical protein B0A68_19030 [Flavobacterium reichenbachii]
MKTTFPYPYYIYGSEDSTDQDVIIIIPKEEMPETQEERKNKVLFLLKEYNLNWNATFAVIENGKITDTIYTKSWIDSLNNALLETYFLHAQKHELLVREKHVRNKTLAIYKAVRTVLTLLTRTEYRTQIRPILKGIHDFNLKLEALCKVDFTAVSEFNQKNTADADIWKIIAFYVGQNIALIENDIEIYTKKNLVKTFPDLEPFIYRKEITATEKIVLQQYINRWLKLLNNFGTFRSENGFLICKEEKIDMLNEKF